MAAFGEHESIVMCRLPVSVDALKLRDLLLGVLAMGILASPEWGPEISEAPKIVACANCGPGHLPRLVALGLSDSLKAATTRLHSGLHRILSYFCH